MKRGKIIGLFLLISLFLISNILAVESGVLTGSVGFSVNVQGGMICNRTSLQWQDYRSNVINPPTRNATGENSNCYHQFGINELSGATDTSCCGSRATCQINDPAQIDNWQPWDGGTNIFTCQITAKNFCWDYNENVASCTENGNGNPDVAMRTLALRSISCGRSGTWQETRNTFQYTCWNNTDCRCFWNATSLGESGCAALTNVTKECQCNAGQGGCVGSNNPIGTCRWELDNSEDHCSDGGGYITYYWKGYPEGQTTDPTCNGQQVPQTIDCSSIVMMDFFDRNNFIICILVISIIYSLQLIFNKKEK